MQAIVVDGDFGLDHLKLTERPAPEPGPGQVLLEMKAAALNYRDLMTVKGVYNRKQPLPLVPCSDGVGEVTAVGEGVRRVSVGDRVAPIFCQEWISGPPARDKLRSTLGGPLDGTLAEQMVLSAEGVVKVPEHLSNAEAASLACAGVTAWSALVERGSLRAGETVLIQGTGGVALFAAQLAHLFGARPIVISSSDEKLARLGDLGVAKDDRINYRQTPQWGKRVKELTGGEGVDHVIELGGAQTLAESLRAIKIGGHIAVIGVLSGGEAQIAVTALLMRQVRLQGILVGHREGFEAMNRAIALHQLRPVIDKTFPFAETRGAFEHLESARHFGKIAISH